MVARCWPLARLAAAPPVPVRHLLQHTLHSGGLTSRQEADSHSGGLTSRQCVGWPEADSHKEMEETLRPAGDGTDDGLQPTAGVAGDGTGRGSQSAASLSSEAVSWQLDKQNVCWIATGTQGRQNAGGAGTHGWRHSQRRDTAHGCWHKIKIFILKAVWRCYQ